MRKTRSSAVFGGKVAYVPQTPWIRNLALRGNVILDMAMMTRRGRLATHRILAARAGMLTGMLIRLQEGVKVCTLQTDINMLP